MNPLLSPEQELLIMLCRLDFTADMKERIKELLTKVNDWDSFAELINEHGISALVCNNLSETGLLENIPEKPKERLEQALLVSLARNTYLSEKAFHYIGILNAEGIDTVPVKGLPLELKVYGNAGLRQMNDVDIFISGDQCMKARKILMSNGFIQAPLKSPLYNSILPFTGKHLPSLYKDDLSIEIHHNIFNWDIDLNTWFRTEAIRETVNGTELFFPKPKLHFLYLVKHLDHHEGNGESQLRLYTDLYLMVVRYRDILINDELYLLARKARMEFLLYAKLALLREFWGLDYIDSPLPGNWNSVLKEFLKFMDKPKGHPMRSRPAGYRKTVKQIPGFHRKCLFVLGDLFPSLTFMKNRYHTRNRLTAIIYYPHRLGKLLFLVKG